MILRGMVVLVMLYWPMQASAATPAETLKAYLRAIYARDYGVAYHLISPADRKLKTEQEYVQELGAFSGAALELAAVLASLIKFENLTTQIAKNRATVTFKGILPNANAPAIQELLLGFDQERLDALSPVERTARTEQLRDMQRAGSLPVLVGEQEHWELVREEGRWWIVLNWVNWR